VGTTVKLARAAGLDFPLSLGSSRIKGAKAKVQMAMVYRLFCLAAVCKLISSGRRPSILPLSRLARIGLGKKNRDFVSHWKRNLQIATLKQGGPSALFQGVLALVDGMCRFPCG